MTTFFRRRYVTGQDFQAEAVADHILGLVLEGLLRGWQHRVFSRNVAS